MCTYRRYPCQAMPDSSLRKIIHIDCDCFYAAVEMRDDPSLRGRPVAVGGSPERRGVISTCNYEARSYGVHSALPSAVARRLCPGLIIIPPDFTKYSAVSSQIRAIFHDYTELVEPLSLDEAFLDVTDATACRGSATLIAREIRTRVRDDIGITVSAGVAPNKFLAKVASDWNKPDGEKVILPEDIEAFVSALPVTRVFGVGRATAERLARLGVRTCGELQVFSIFELTERFGRFGARLFDLCRGHDERPVKSDHRRKSLSVERTYADDINGLDSCKAQLAELMVKLRSRLRTIGSDYLVTKLFVKVKFADFQQTTVECVGKEVLEALFVNLLGEALERHEGGVRLLGVGVRFLDLRADMNPAQLELFERSSN